MIGVADRLVFKRKICDAIKSWFFKIETIAREKKCKPAQMALAWVLARGNDIVPIPGTKRRAYLDENIAALNIQLTFQDKASIDEIFLPGAVAGNRYDERGMQAVNL